MVALLCGTSAWADTYTKINSIDELTDGKYVIAYKNTMAMVNQANGSRIAATTINVSGDAITNPDASIIWDITTTTNGVSISNSGIYVAGVNDNKASLSDFEANVCEWNFSVENDNFRATNVQYTDRFLQYNSSSKWFACYKASSKQQDLTLYKLQETGKSDPELAFTGITGDVTKQLTEGSYSSAATTASDATITYSSSDTEVATINQEGLVTLLAGGTTVIKAEVAETETFDAASVEYTLKVVDPALVKTFAKVTDGTVTDGQYIIGCQKNNDDASVWVMNTTNTKNYFEYTIVELSDGKFVTDNE